MSVSPLMLRVAEIAWELDKSGNITVQGILDILDSENDYNKSEYRHMYTRIYWALRRSQNLGFALWNMYTETQKYKLDYRYAEYYLRNDNGKVWRNKYFKIFYDMRVFTKRQMEDSIVEAKLFESFIEKLKEKNILFVIAGRGKREYAIPSYHDFCFYKYTNLLQTAITAKHQVESMSDAELMLPEGITISQLGYLSRQLLEELEPPSNA